MNFISLACNIFLCFVLLCAIFISSAKTKQECFFSHMPSHPLKNKMVRIYHESETRQCYLSHTVSAFALSIISYRHAARNVFVQFYGNSFAETVCKPFLKPHSDWYNFIGFCSQDSHEEYAFCRENGNELLQANSASVNCKLFINSGSQCSLQSLAN